MCSIRLHLASYLPLRRELGAIIGCGWRLLGYHCWLSAAWPFGSLAPSAFAGCWPWLACEGGLLSAFVEQNKKHPEHTLECIELYEICCAVVGALGIHVAPLLL